VALVALVALAPRVAVAVPDSTCSVVPTGVELSFAFFLARISMSLPTVFPLTQIEQVIARLRGDTSVSVAQLVADAYDVLGYALGQVLPQAPTAAALPPNEAVAQLEASLPKSRSNDATAAAINWAGLVPILINLIQALLPLL
jgi:hypothetical protein